MSNREPDANSQPKRPRRWRPNRHGLAAAAAASGDPTGLRPDRESERWVEQLHHGHPRCDQAMSRLHEVLLRVAFHEFEVSSKVARNAWRRQPPSRHELAFEQLPDSLVARPAARLEQREQLKALSTAIGDLTDRQREVFVAIALNDVPIDVLAIQLDTNRNAIYKNLFDARRNLRASMAAAGHPVLQKDAA